ncbi:MAG: hypothetical protein PVF05_05170 [Gemmatimonadales bacterium]
MTLALTLFGGTNLAAQEAGGGTAQLPALFGTSDRCIACHTGLVSADGVDVSIGMDWRASMMANAARDPYWQAAVRREILDHPETADEIQGECSICHMPMARATSIAVGSTGQVFAHLPIGAATAPLDLLAADGVSCSLCHQIQPDGLGEPASFVGGFVLAPGTRSMSAAGRDVFGPYAVDSGRTRVMRSATGFSPRQSDHLKDPGLCGSCHTLYTHTRGPGGDITARFPEQMPYLEWEHSAYPGKKGCQDCHMPTVDDSTAISAVLGQPRPAVSRHVFRGGNFFMLRVLNRYRSELGVLAGPRELELAATRTIEHLQSNTARVSVVSARLNGGRLEAEIAVENLTGHKLPTAYPSRRAWLHVKVSDGAGRAVFESGALAPDARIVGNDNDADPGRYEPHHPTITRADQVQVYEAIMAGSDGAVTTGLLTAVRYVKDNRLLPRGFDAATAPADVAVRGEAASDPDFRAAGDRVRYLVDVGDAAGPLQVEAELVYQSISYRWARNLSAYDAFETRRFVRYYESMSSGTAVVLAADSATIP